nr:hypothetical protein BaRGS_004834 [Batillaria attramentaria]
MINMAGVFVGSPLVGFLCDWMGRKPSYFVCLLILTVVGTISAFPPSVPVFLVYRFLSGVANIGTYLSLYVLALEVVGPSKRTFASSLLAVVWLVGPFLVAGLSYVVKDWWKIQIISSAPLVLSFATWWLIPESPRWLLSEGRIVQGVGVIRKIARVNKIALPPVLGSLEESDEQPKAKEGASKLLKYPNLVVRTLIIFFNWAVVTMAYYGLSLNVSNLVGNVRVNFMLSNTVELVGYVAAWILLDRVGRKRLHCGFMLLAGSAMLATIPTVIFGGTELQWLTTALAMVGKLGVSASFSVIYLMSAELYPTVIRNFGMGCSSTVARVGSAVSPYIADLGLYIEGSFGRALPLIVFGGLAVTAGLLSLMLPETLHRKLPDTLEEAANFGKKEKVTEDREDALEMDGHLPKENQRLQESADTPD